MIPVFVERRHRLVVLGVIGVVAAVLLVPPILQRLDFFRVRQIELVGVRYHSPEQVLRAADIESDRNVFASLGEIERRLRRVAGIVDVRVERHLPGTLHIAVTERAPVAFASGPDGLVALDERAQPLPYDPTLGEIDVPVIERPDSLVTRALWAVRRVDPELYAVIDAAGRSGGAVIVRVGARSVLFTDTPDATAIEQVGAVHRHLTAIGEDYVELDARYADLVVVRRDA